MKGATKMIITENHNNEANRTNTKNRSKIFVPVNTIRKRLDLSPSTEDFLDALDSIYTGETDIYDTIAKYADKCVCINKRDPLSAIKKCPSYAEKALDLYGWEGCGKSMAGISRRAESLICRDVLCNDMKSITTSLILDELDFRNIDAVSREFTKEMEDSEIESFKDVMLFVDCHLEECHTRVPKKWRLKMSESQQEPET